MPKKSKQTMILEEEIVKLRAEAEEAYRLMGLARSTMDAHAKNGDDLADKADWLQTLVDRNNDQGDEPEDD